MIESVPPEAPPSRPMSPLAGALWSVALTMTVLFAVSATESARPGAQSDIVSLAACYLLATSLIVFLMVRWHAREVSLRTTLGLQPIALLPALLSIAAGAALSPLASTLNDLVLRRWPIDDAELAEHAAKVFSSASRPAFCLAYFVVIPIAGEVFFRGILYGGLRATVPRRSALLATAVFFACSSLEPREIPAMFALGLALVWLRERAGTVLAPVLAQLAYGAVDAIPILRGRDPNVDVTYPARWLAGCAVIAVLAVGAVGAGRREE